MEDIFTFTVNYGKGIGNKTRYKILVSLAEGERTVGQLAELVGISQPTASQHLKLLKAGHLITDQKKGQYVFYALNYDYILSGLKQLVAGMESGLDKTIKKGSYPHER
jgi:DNA-binding transcriptional ArsR family regulator